MSQSTRFLRNKSLLGFTLIELMVTLAIIGIVFGLIITSAGAIQRSGRDAQRKSDIATIQGALQQYYADQNFFPNTLPSSGGITSSVGRPTPYPTPVKTYLKAIPKDPSTNNYTYNAFNTGCTNASGVTCTNYCLYTTLENPQPTPSPSTCPVSGTTNYYVTQP